MANKFNRYVATDVTTNRAVITCPADKAITVIGLVISNTSGLITNVSVELAGGYVVKNAIVINGSAIVPVGNEQKIVMVAGDTLSVSADNSVDVIASVLETTV
jgi:hypothetical protein